MKQTINLIFSIFISSWQYMHIMIPHFCRLCLRDARKRDLLASVWLAHSGGGRSTSAHANMESGKGMFVETQSKQDTPLGALAQAMGTPPRSRGKVASAISSNISEPQFKGNALAESTETKLDAEAEVAAFRDSK